MTRVRRARKPSRRRHPLRQLHRYGGLATSLLVVVICITGLALNHTDTLRLGKTYVGAGWLLDLYGVHTPSLIGYRVNGRLIISDGDTLYFATRPAARLGTRPDQVSATAAEIRVDAGARTWLFTTEGALIETIETELIGLPVGRAAPVSPVPADLAAEITRHHRSRVITLERLLLDIHTGRIGGKLAVWLVDTAAVLFIALALSGLWLFARRRH